MQPDRGVMLLAFALTLMGPMPAFSQPIQTSERRLQSTEYGAVALAAKAELIALGSRVVFPVCVTVTQFRTAPKGLLRYLRRERMQASPQTTCYPPKQYPRGLKIGIERIRRDPEGQLVLLVDTSDETLRPEDHFAERLRFGSYRLEQNKKGEWRILNYDAGER